MTWLKFGLVYFRIGLITQCLPKTPVLGIDINHDFTEPGTFSQRAMNRLESQVNSSAHVKETCDKFINILHDIFNFAASPLTEIQEFEK